VKDNTNTKEIQTYVQAPDGIQNHDLSVGAKNMLIRNNLRTRTGEMKPLKCEDDCDCDCSSCRCRHSISMY